MSSENALKTFGEKITKIINKKNLTQEEAEECWNQVLKNQQPDLQQGAFLAALAAKGESHEEITAAWKSIYEQDTIHIDLSHLKPLVENCGTGMDRLKTFNISTGASIIAAAHDIYMAKHGARAITSKCGTIDVLEHLGVDVECPLDIVQNSIETAKIGIFNGMSKHTHPSGLFRLLQSIRFGTTLNIAGSLANPANPKIGLRGVYSPTMTEKVLLVMKEMGYERAMVVYGWDENHTEGMDELSILGDTQVGELANDGTLDYYWIKPELYDIPRVSYDQVATSFDVHEDALTLLRVLAGKDESGKRDIVCLNAAPLFYLTEMVDSIDEGFKLANDVVDEGSAMEQLVTWVQTQSRNPEQSIKQFNSLYKEM